MSQNGGIKMNINMIGVPIMYGCDRNGAECGPDKLRKNGIIEIIKESGHHVYDLGNINIPQVSEDEKFAGHEKIKYLSPVVEINTNLAQSVYCTLESGYFPFVIGGDHSLALGSIAGASKHFKKNMAVIWIDAHRDTNTFQTTPSANAHGMPLSSSMDQGNEKLRNVYFEGKKLEAENVYIIGARQIDPGEFELEKRIDINLYDMDKLRHMGLENVISEVIGKIKESNVDGVHLSFDIDSLDESIVPGTGTPEAGGFSLEEGKQLFTEFLGQDFVTSMDFVEFNPLLDKDDITLKTCIEILEHIFSLLK